MPFSNHNVLKTHQVKALKKKNAYRKASVILKAEARWQDEGREAVPPLARMGRKPRVE